MSSPAEVIAFLVSLTLAVPPGSSTAPVYTFVREGVLERTGTLVYKAEGYEVIYCISQPPRITINCVVRTPSDRLVLVETQATEQGT